jgi:hypothetical protein
MLEFFMDNIFAMFGERVFQLTAPLLADLFLYSYEADFIQGFLKKTKRNYPDPLIPRSAI